MADESVGRARIDPYAWLKDDNWKEVMRNPKQLRPDIRAYLEAENAYTNASLETPPLPVPGQYKFV